MLGKRDPIFWAATCITVVAVALGAAIGQEWMLLLLAAYLLRPTLHSIGLAKKLIDERQMQIQFRASNVAFSVLVAGNVLVAVVLMQRGNHAWEMIGAVLMVAIATRALTGLLLVGDPLVAGQRIVTSVGLLLGLFSALEVGFPWGFVAMLPGLAFAALGFLARRRPQLVAAFVAIVGLLVAAAYVLAAVRRPQGLNWGSVLACGLILVPLGAAALSLWIGARDGDADVPADAAAERASV
jgi:hypothetical protein